MKPVAIFRHSPGEGPGYFSAFLDRRLVPWQLIKIDETPAVPTDPCAFSGLAFMGGPMSVNDPLPWIEQELALICAAQARNIPVIGHCLGGQLMAKAFGAVVTRNPVKEIGWGTVRVLDNPIARTWFGELPEFHAFHWHGETFSLPPAAIRILESSHCASQAFALGPHLGMQCHVEMTEAMIRLWNRHWAAENAAPGPSVQTPAQMAERMEERLASMRVAADRLYTRWIEGLQHG
ncbi:MAG: type 1 glutamine amidotransferase [Sterolibacterium sp.]